MSSLCSNVLAAKARLAEGLQQAEQRHQTGCSGVELCASVTDLRDEVLRDLFETALADAEEAGTDDLRRHVAMVAHGGYGRRDVAPYSDVDLMILYAPAARRRACPLAERLLRDVFDASLMVGHSVRTPDEAAVLAGRDAVIATSLIESRLLAGSETLFAQFEQRFRRHVRRQPGKTMNAIVASRLKERARYGETVYLLEPNIKRSRGSLRDIHLLRWIGFVRYGTPDPHGLLSLEVLSQEDFEAIDRADEFLLRLRNEMHFHSGKTADVLDRFEQLRIAERFDYGPSAGMMPVERLMRDYFRHTARISHVTTRFVAKARSKDRLTRLVTAVFGHRIEQNLHVGPAGILATGRGLEHAGGKLTAIMQMADLANLYSKPIAAETWEEVRREASHLPQQPCAEACRHFLSLVGYPARLGALLRDLHDAGVLECFIPVMAHARGLMPFSWYHSYTVDEHCLRAVDFATKLLFDMGPLGCAYRRIKDKRLLHLALLIHDLGKGFAEDHCEVGLRIAQETAGRLGLARHETEVLKFLVHEHLLMNHLAFRRDLSDEQLVVRFALQVGSPKMLQMLFVLTAADLAAVGPGVWDAWKAEILTELFDRTMHHLAGQSPANSIDQRLRRRREAVRGQLGPQGDRPWFVRQLDGLPAGYLGATEPEQVAADLRLLRGLEPHRAVARGCYLPETDTLQFTIATDETITSGVFHKLTGALTSCGMQIRSAQINTLTDGLVLDRFRVSDPDYSGQPSPERIEQVNAALVQSLRQSGGQASSFRQTWRAADRAKLPDANRECRVNTDCGTSDRCTILDVFADDRPGLLSAITRTLFDLELPVACAKIATYGDQVVDVFYVTDRQGRKIEDRQQLDEIRTRLLQVIDTPRQQ